jgi:hypothetical protein
MRTALLISGNIRTFTLCSKSFDTLVAKFDDVDVFIFASNLAFDLHPFVKQTYNFYGDSILDIESIKRHLGHAPLLKSKIRKITILDTSSEDAYILNEYSDVGFNELGLDIFKQFLKFDRNIDKLKEYASQNKITYDYIIKTRFDLEIDINSIPITLEHDSIYTSPGSQPGWINDVIFISKDIHTLKTITNSVIASFLKNKCIENIHIVLTNILLGYNIKNIPTIFSELNRNYSNLTEFDTTITLITCFYNIGRNNWKHSSRSNDVYFKNCENVMRQKYPLFIFTTEEYKERCLEIRKKTDKEMKYTHIIIIPFEELYLFDRRNEIAAIQQSNLKNIYPIQERIQPEFCAPEYIIVINNKLKFMSRVASENIYKSEIFQWIDFGIHQNIVNSDMCDKIFCNIHYQPRKIRLVGFLPISGVITNRIEFYNIHKSTVAAGLIAGDKDVIYKLADECEKEFTTIMQSGLMNQEQYMLYYILCNRPELFDYSRINNWDELGHAYLLN